MSRLRTGASAPSVLSLAQTYERWRDIWGRCRPGKMPAVEAAAERVFQALLAQRAESTAGIQAKLAMAMELLGQNAEGAGTGDTDAMKLITSAALDLAMLECSTPPAGNSLPSDEKDGTDQIASVVDANHLTGARSATAA
jgi:hypothetical protein